MIGRHEAELILACRAAGKRGSVITEDQARDVAALWHSPSRHSVGISAFSHSGKRLPSLRSEVERELRGAGDAVSRLELRSLLKWINANPIEVIRYEHVFFWQGDEADEVLKLIYPDTEEGSTGWPDGAAAALDEIKLWDCGEPTDVPDSYERPDASYGSEMVYDEHHALAWNSGLTWAALYRKVKEVG